MKNINKLKRLIRKECSNHFTEQGSINHYCCMIDGVCLFFENEENKRCQYFEEGLLPLDGDLERVYYIEIDVKPINAQGNKAKPRIKCKNCGKNVEANSNRQQYCHICKKNIKRKQARESMKKKRDKG
ncbi:hypothetical protein OSC52_11960 [Clostridium pasteurianum]|uniref:hypothetical protein n=1 Tax=Clostridium pasteurianum TaxID=1501 RepID=UPI00226082F6|nr:hypothetical protein [Clostridium pasteurianum]UZW12570.1 hypothetical protein OSC52_11960 [Clostridium pasteurianum]